MKILLSAYGCEPHKGSEPGVGWRWAVELAKLGHEVWVLTRENNRPSIEDALSRQPVAGLQFVYHDLSKSLLWLKRHGMPLHLYLLLWQFRAFFKARRLRESIPFDLVHHLTFGGLRSVTFLPFLGLPTIIGPLGGGEAAPPPLRKSYFWQASALSLVRDLSNRLVALDPLKNAAFARAYLILCKTPDTLAFIPRRFHHKCRLHLEIGSDVEYTDVPARDPHTVRVLFVGRLLYWKGVHLAIRAFAAFHRANPASSLTIIGSGPDEGRFRRLARQLGVDRAIRWHPWMPQSQVMTAYRSHDVLLFPSFNDSSGNVVLEAMASGLPVVISDVGGPACIADDSCAWIVPAAGRDEADFVAHMAAALQALASDPALHRRLARNALKRARRYRWESVVGGVYGPEFPLRTKEVVS